LFISEEWQRFYEFGKKLMDIEGIKGFGSVNLEKKLEVHLPSQFYFFSNLFSFIVLAMAVVLFPLGASFYWFLSDGEQNENKLPYNPIFLLAGLLIFVLTSMVYGVFGAVFIVVTYGLIATIQEKFEFIKKDKIRDNIFGISAPAIIAIVLFYSFWLPRSHILVTDVSLLSIRYRNAHGLDKRTLAEAVFRLNIRNEGETPVKGISIKSRESTLHLHSMSIKPGEIKTSDFVMPIDSYPKQFDLSVGTIYNYYPLTTRVYIPEDVYELAKQLENSHVIKNILVEGATGSGKTTFIGDVCRTYRNDNSECRAFISGWSPDRQSHEYSEHIFSPSGIDSFILIDKYGFNADASNESNITEEHLTAVLSGYIKQKGPIDIDISKQLVSNSLNTYIERVKKLTPEFILERCGRN